MAISWLVLLTHGLGSPWLAQAARAYDKKAKLVRGPTLNDLPEGEEGDVRARSFNGKLKTTSDFRGVNFTKKNKKVSGREPRQSCIGRTLTSICLFRLVSDQIHATRSKANRN